MTTLLDLTDSKICLWHDDTSVLSPGYVCFDGDNYRFGLAAQGSSRRTPKAVNTRFWSQLSTQSLAPPLGPARHTADLVHQHLEALYISAHKPKACLVAVPGTMTREQLSLLLGIVQHLPFDIDGLVHRTALLASASGLHRGQHVELQLHQTVITAFEERAGSLCVLDTQTLPSHGLLALQDALAMRISDVFVHQTRFDPLRSADTEQALYDALPTLLATLKETGESRLSLSGYDARITAEDLTAVGIGFSKQLSVLLSTGDMVLVEDPLTLLPGLSLGVGVQAINSAMLLPSATVHAGLLKQAPGELSLCRQLPCTASSEQDQSTPQAPQVEPAADTARPVTSSLSKDQSPSLSSPTHILQGAVATPLVSIHVLPSGVMIRREGNALSLAGDLPADLQINHQPALQGQTLLAGDVLSDALGLHATLICVEP